MRYCLGTCLPPIETALRFLAQDSAEVMPGRRRRTIVGTPEEVRAGIEAVAHEYQADEVMVVTITHAHEDRRRSYELLMR